MQEGRLRFLAWFLPLGLLLGCASTSPKVSQTPPEAHAVVGAGTEDDRAVIGSSNQQILNLEHQQSSDPAAAAGTPNPNLP